MPNLFPRFTAALRNFAAQQLAVSTVAKAIGKLASRIHRDERSTRAAARSAADATRKAVAQTKRAERSGAVKAKQAEEFRDAVLSKITTKNGNVGDLIEAMLRPGGKSLTSLEKELEAAAKLLEQFGYSVQEPEGAVAPAAKPRHGRQQSPQKPSTPQRDRDDEPDVQFEEAGRDLGNLRVGGRQYRFAPDDAILTGEMIPVDSSNVHSVGYIWNDDNPMKGTLRVRFLGTNRGSSPQSRGGKGPVYHYIGVHPEVFQAFRIAASKGKFVWDRLRVRGTVTGHQFDYELAVLEKSGYVPRKATRIGGDEFFMRRTVKGKNGKTYRSALQDEFVRHVGENNPPPGVIAGRGAPNRGAPNRGKPNRGRP